ncbi:MAG: hypothetical protein AB1633_12120 [Elusimicrobiota bacterium]
MGTTTTVIFGKEIDATIMGVVTLEECGLTVDPINRKLVPLTKIHHFIINSVLFSKTVSSGVNNWR